VLKQLRPPHRILMILEGESLLNDATALLIYRLAVGAVAMHAFSAGSVAPTLAVVVVGSVAVGIALSWAMLWLTRSICDVPTAIIVQFVGTFGVWLLAERLNLSPVLTMVVFAMAVARRAPESIPARQRIPSYAVWESAVFVLNVLAFVFIGLQIRPIMEGLAPEVRTRYLIVAGAVLLTCIVVRFAWVMIHNTVKPLVDQAARLPSRAPAASADRPRRVRRVVGGHARDRLAGRRAGLSGGLSSSRSARADGLRGRPRDSRRPGADVEALDAAASPRGGRSGLSEVAEARRARLAAVRAALPDDESPEARFVLHAFQARLDGLADDGAHSAGAEDGHDRLFRRAFEAARRVAFAMRARDEIGDDAFHRLEEDLDWLEMSAGVNRKVADILATANMSTDARGWVRRGLALRPLRRGIPVRAEAVHDPPPIGPVASPSASLRTARPAHARNSRTRAPSGDTFGTPSTQSGADGRLRSRSLLPGAHASLENAKSFLSVWVGGKPGAERGMPREL
jgi:CPA1 family monovalent cation:H+ antiporter